MEHDVIQLGLPADNKFLSVIGVCIAALLEHVPEIKEPDMVTYNIQLAVHEVCANVIEHAYQGNPEDRYHVVLTLAESPLRLEVELNDQGQSFSPPPKFTPNINQLPTRGYGLFLIHQLMDQVIYTSKPGHNQWRLVKYLVPESRAV
jgi:serine/threonine-protein kinase RsbW